LQTLYNVWNNTDYIFDGCKITSEVYTEIRNVSSIKTWRVTVYAAQISLLRIAYNFRISL
jgi:hypothetical protein